MIGVGAVVFGYLAYKLLSKGGSKTKTYRPEDDIIGITPGGPQASDEVVEEAKTKVQKVVPPSDSEDEPLVLKQSIQLRRDAEGLLDKETLIRIFDKRSSIRGMRKLDRTFKDKRRAAFQDQNEYK